MLLRDGEAWLLGSYIMPLKSISTHTPADPTRTRKLLLHEREIAEIFQAVQSKGNSCVTTAMYWKGSHVKCEVALGKGKKTVDKRATTKERDWERQKRRLISNYNR